MIVAQTGTMNSAYILCTILLMVSAFTSMLTKAPSDLPDEESWIGRMGEIFAKARRQPVDVYLGANYL
jgi:hypothetical protein